MATNLVNGKQYIGQSINNLTERKHRHFLDAKRQTAKDRCCIFYPAIRKYGFESFEWEVLWEGTCPKRLNELEVFFIEFHSSRIFGYNIHRGGSLPWNPPSFEERSDAAKKTWETMRSTPGALEKRKENIREATVFVYTIIKSDGELCVLTGCDELGEFIRKNKIASRHITNNFNLGPISNYKPQVRHNDASGWICKKEQKCI